MYWPPGLSFINQVACNLGFLTHPTAGLFPQYIFTTDGFLGLEMSVEFPKYIVQRSVNMNAAGAAGLQERFQQTSAPARRSDGVCLTVFLCLYLFTGLTAIPINLIFGMHTHIRSDCVIGYMILTFKVIKDHFISNKFLCLVLMCMCWCFL